MGNILLGLILFSLVTIIVILTLGLTKIVKACNILSRMATILAGIYEIWGGLAPEEFEEREEGSVQQKKIYGDPDSVRGLE